MDDLQLAATIQVDRQIQLKYVINRRGALKDNAFA